MSITIDGGAGITFPDTVQQTNGMTMTGGNPRYYAARAWVSFNGNSGAIFAQANIASVSRTNTGRYTISFVTNMPDANYAAITTAGMSSANAQYYNARFIAAPSVSSFSIGVMGLSSGNVIFVDADYVHVVVFR